MAYTLAQLRVELAKALDSYVTGTATSGSTTTVVDTSLLDSGEYADDHFNGADVYIYDTTDDAAPEGEARYCTDFAQSTGTITVGKPFTAVVGANDVYEIYLRATVEELNQALMFAVKDWRFVSSDDLVNDQAEYQISADHLHTADQIVGIWIREGDDAGVPYKQLNDYRIWDNAGTITVDFSDSYVQDTTLYARIEYEARFSQLISSGAFLDTASVGGDLHMHVLNAKKYYYERKMVGASGVDRDWYASMVRYTNEQLQEMGGDVRRQPSKAKLQDFEQKGHHRYQPDWWI